jgi:hypothetical protein
VREAFVTERDTAAILLELRRIGVDVASLPDALVATGFRSHSLLEWLCEVPSELGSDELLHMLDERAAFALATSERAGSGAQLLPEFDEALPRQWWPTAEMLGSAIDLLLNEWDPVGVRLGSVPPEDIGEYAFHFVTPLLGPWRCDDRLTSVADKIAAVEQGLLGLRVSPEVHRRYLAARLREVVGRHPPSQHPFRRPPRSQAIAMVSSADLPPTLPNDRAPVLSAESRSWHDAVDFLRVVIIARDDPERGKEITPELLRAFASELAADADKMDGPMPDEVESFVRQYSTP